MFVSLTMYNCWIYIKRQKMKSTNLSKKQKTSSPISTKSKPKQSSHILIRNYSKHFTVNNVASQTFGTLRRAQAGTSHKLSSFQFSSKAHKSPSVYGSGRLGLKVAHARTTVTAQRNSFSHQTSNKRKEAQSQRNELFAWNPCLCRQSD